MLPTPLCALVALAPLAAPQAEDLRTAYDVLAYDLELAVRPDTETLEGQADVVAVALRELDVVRLDLDELHEVLAVQTRTGVPLVFERVEDGLLVSLPGRLLEGDPFTVRVRYRGQPEGGGFSGFHWAESKDGSPWINTSCQGLGAHYWYPCKASYFHPDDKPERVSMAITCPADLVGVSNGRLVGVEDGGPEWFDERGAAWKTYRWAHDYPLETYTVTLNVGPYRLLEGTLDVPGLDEPVPYAYYVLPESVEKAELQFAQVPELVRVFSEAFGPFPFPESKFGLVETNFWGMEHSTAVAYGSSYPAWCEANGEEDPYASRNRWFDYILVHEVAHEWWGNAVSAEHWGHFWIHEGFGTYAEGVYVEFTQGRDAADRYFAEKLPRVARESGSLYRGDRPDSGEAYAGLIYSRGSYVLHTLRHYVGDDEAWWRSLREFNLDHRYCNATTEDFRAVLERNTGRSWERFFDEWFYGEGSPSLSIRLSTAGTTITVEVENTEGSFLVPLDVTWTANGERRRERLWVEPGTHTLVVACDAPPSDVAVEHLDRLLGKHEVEDAG